MSEKIILSVAIPTYNGAATIAEALESIVVQLEKRVEVVVSDNASTDNTSEIVAQYQARYPNIRYYRNPNNLGGERNIDLMIQRSRGNYVWTLGDDDKVAVGGIAKVLEVLSHHPGLAFIFVNPSIWARNFDKCSKERFLPLNNDMIFDDANDFFKIVGANAAFTPCLVTNRHLWLEMDTTPFDGTGWKTLCKLFYLLPGRRVYIIATPYALFRGGSMRHHVEGKFYMQTIALARLFNTLPDKGYNEIMVRKSFLKIKNNLPITIIFQKYYGLKVTANVIRDSAEVFGQYIYFWFVCIPLLLIPNSVYRIGRTLLRPNIMYCLARNIYRKITCTYRH